MNRPWLRALGTKAIPRIALLRDRAANSATEATQKHRPPRHVIPLGALGIIVAALLFAAANTAAATLQARLVRATNEPRPTDARLNDIEPKLKKQFGYTSYQQMGAQQDQLQDATLQRLDLGEGFVVFAKLKGIEKKSYELEIEWTSGKASLVKTTAKISTGHHLFIKGPGVAEDWIVLALTVRE